MEDQCNQEERPSCTPVKRTPFVSAHVFDAESTRCLERVLHQLGCFDYRYALRLEALATLEALLCRWAHSLENAIGTLPENDYQRPGVSLITFGSYRLGVHRPSSDLDVLALCPEHCSRREFFSSLVSSLKLSDGVSNVHPIPSAYTPVIKCVIKNIQIDLLFARTANSAKLLEHQAKQSLCVRETEKAFCQSPRLEYLIEDSDLIDLDEVGVRCLNGVRVTQELLDLVPKTANFRLVLRAVKAWAESHGVNSNVLGFLGGINWAILTAWVCIQHPHEEPSKLLTIFFTTFASWKWPRPVVIRPVHPHPPEGVAPLPFWNPKDSPRDRSHLMPIITPAYPSMNSSYNVGLPQLRRIQDEMARTACLLKEKENWESVLSECNFFEQHSNFIQVNIRAWNSEDFLEWFRLCASRLRLLIASLETLEVNAWPYARFFDRRYGSSGFCEGSGVSDSNCIHESCFFIALRFAHGIESVDLRPSTLEYLRIVNNWDGRRVGMDLSISRLTASELPSFVTETMFKIDRDHAGTSMLTHSEIHHQGSPMKKTRKQ